MLHSDRRERIKLNQRVLRAAQRSKSIPKQNELKPQQTRSTEAVERVDKSISSATKGMFWVIFTKNPRSKARRPKWVYLASHNSWVDALMDYHNATEEGYSVMLLLTKEEHTIWLERLNGPLEN